MGRRDSTRPTYRHATVALALLYLVFASSLVQPAEGKMRVIKRNNPAQRSTRNVGGQPRAPTEGDGPSVSKRTYRDSFQLDGVSWQRHRDSKSGKEYYFNVATKESTWEDPRRAVRETEEWKAKAEAGGSDAASAGESDGAPADGEAPRVIKRPGLDPKEGDDRGDALRRPMDGREAFTRKAEARDRVRAAKKFDRARQAAGAPPAPKRHGPFVRGTVAVSVMSTLVSCTVWLVGALRTVSARSGPGGTRDAADTGPLAVELREEAVEGARRWWAKTKERVRARGRELSGLVRDVRSSTTAADARAKIGVAIKNAEQAPELFLLARFLIAVYYFNLCADKYSEYVWRYQYWEYAERYGLNQLGLNQHSLGGEVVSPSGFPWIAAAVVTCTTMMIHNIYPVRCSLFVLAYDVLDSLGLFFEIFVTGRLVLNELVMKKLALFGCTCLLVAHSVKDQVKEGGTDPFAALAMEDGDGKRRKDVAGVRKSALLLVARVMMACLYFFVGLNQMRRVVARDFALFASPKRIQGIYHDGHDNNWLLLEFLLALPLSAGYKQEVSARALTATLFAEAVTCWRFWAPRTFRPDHARSHFVTNLACGGGLILLQAFGAGRYTVDNYVKNKKKM